MSRLQKTARAAIAKWGMVEQICQVQEECGETVAAINQYRRRRISIKQLASEAADLIIGGEQLRQIVNDEGGDVESAVDAKLTRLEGRIDG